MRLLMGGIIRGRCGIIYGVTAIGIYGLEATHQLEKLQGLLWSFSKVI
jgi:hypothetical protein